MQPIQFYDIPRNHPVHKSFAPNPLKTRIALNYKNLPYTTIWVEYPEIEPTAIRIGASPTSTKPDGKPYYTTPMIYDPNNKTVLSDSHVIACYLDKTYPSTPRILLPPNATLEDAAQRAREMEEEFFGLIGPALFGLLIVPGWNALNPVSQPYFRQTREAAMGGVRLEDAAPPGSQANADRWRELEATFALVAKWMDDAVEKYQGLFSSQNQKKELSHGDIIVGAFLLGFEIAWGAESEEWQRVILWHGGRWARMMKRLEPYRDDTH